LRGPWKLSHGTAAEEDEGEKRSEEQALLLLKYVEHWWARWASKHTDGIIRERAGPHQAGHIGHSEGGIPIPLQNFIFNKFRESHLITLLCTLSCRSKHFIMIAAVLDGSQSESLNIAVLDSKHIHSSALIPVQ
jgi:hypothetical protein